MKKLKSFAKVAAMIVAVATLSLGFSAPVFAADDSEAVTPFHFSSFSADYYLSRDASGFSKLKVEETLVAEFQKFGNYNHGIERALPMFYKFDGAARTETHSFDLTIDGVSENSTTYKDGDFLVVRMGDADEMVHGTKRYQIAWSAKNVTRNFDDGDEFYWNANGTGWSQNFESVEARVHIPADLVSELDGRVKCGVGARGAAAENCEIAESDDAAGGKIFIFTSVGQVEARETLTFDVGFKMGTFTKPPFDIGAVFGISATAFWFVTILAAILTIGAFIWLIIVIQKFRPTKTGRAIVPEYLPPANLNVVEAAFWYSLNSRQTFFPAALIDLAVKHYIEIIEEKGALSGKKFSLKLIKLPDSRISADQREILEMIFAEKEFKVFAGARKTQEITSENKLEIGKVVKAKDLQKSRKLQKFLSAELPAKVTKRLQQDYKFYRVSLNRISAAVVAAVLLFIGMLIAGVFLESVFVFVLVVPLILLIISIVLFRPISLRGMEAKEYLEGLKMYMKLAEAERLKILQSVKGAERIATDSGEIVKLYEKLLPYAVIFGITKDWAKALQVYYDQNPSFVPVWFVGNLAALGSFDATSFASSLNSFSSSGSGFSSGGGFSGGGGGGGGGGGW